MIKSKLLTTLTLLLRECNVDKINDQDFIIKRNNIGRLEKIIKFIDENYDKDLSLDSIAHKFYFNSSYFSYYFKKNIGINFTEYLAKVRIQEAMRLLDEDRSSTTDISFACGFKNITSFYNSFKKITGKSPSEYKRYNSYLQNIKGIAAVR